MAGLQQNTAPSANTGYKQELNRTLTLKDLVIFGMVTMLPIAPFQVYGAAAVESGGMVPFVYVVGLIAMLFTALSYRQMSQAFPVAGSVYSYVQRGLNPHIGFVIGWVITSDYILAPALLYTFAGLFLSSMVPAVPIIAWVVLFILINTYVNIRGISLAAKTNIMFLIAELIAVALFVTFAIKFVFLGGQGAGGFSAAPIFAPDKIDFSLIATAASIAVLGFIGFDAISTLSEEVKEPQKTVGRATVLSLLIIGGLFILQSYLAALAHPVLDGIFEGENVDMAMYTIAQEVGGEFFYLFLLVLSVVAMGIANALPIQAAISRVIYSMGRDNLLPFSGFLSKVHPKYKTPANATLLIAVVSIIVATTMDLETILKFITFGAITSFIFMNITVFVYYFIKKKQRGLRAIFSYVLCPLAGFSVLAFVWSGFDTMTYILGFSWMAVGILIGYVKSRGYKEVPPALKDL